MAQLKKIFLHQFKYQYHPLVMAQLESQEFELSSDKALHHLTDDDIALLFSDIVLHACLPDGQVNYQLLAYHPVFELLKQHPAAKKHTIQVRIHDQETQAIVTFSLLQPALHHRYGTFSQKEIIQRQRQFKTLAQQPSINYPSTSVLKHIMHK